MKSEVIVEFFVDV